jgi:hypothetical protein
MALPDKPLDDLERANRCAEWLVDFSGRAGSALSSVVGRDNDDRVVYAVVFTHDADAARKLVSLSEGITSETDAPDRPKVVCLCGSTRFREAYERAFYEEEHAGNICLTVPCYKDDPCCKTAADHERLDALHRHKIYVADEIVVVRGREYIGESTRKEIEYARSLGKPVRFR